MKKFKKFIKKYKTLLIVIVLLIVFIFGSVFIVDAKDKKEMKAWKDEVDKPQYVVTTLAASYCQHCANLKPIMNEVQEEYGFKLYWYEHDTISSYSKDYLESAYDLKDNGFDAYPYVFITYKGDFLGYFTGERDKEALIAELQKYGVIETETEDTTTTE